MVGPEGRNRSGSTRPSSPAEGRGPVRALALFALTHALVDACCAGLLFGAVHRGVLSGAEGVAAFLAYNLLAFAVQPLIGAALDGAGDLRPAAATGAALTALALPVAALPGAVVVGVALAGLGNALYHLGAGTSALRASPGRATEVGVFVAPGAAGLALGTALGRGGAPVWPLAAALALAGVAVAAAPPAGRAGTSGGARGFTGPVPVAAVLLVLGVVALRSYTGMAVAFPWRTQPALLVALTAGVVLGKGLGGALADRWGRVSVGVGSLALSLPLLLAGPANPAAGVLGLLAFNVTMPITLAAVADALPGNEAFAFGSTCLALAVGALPVVAGVKVPAMGPLELTALVAVSAALLWLGLTRLSAPARGERAHDILGEEGIA